MCPSILSEPAVKAFLGFIALKRSPKRVPVKTHFEEQKPNLRAMPPTQTSNSGANVSWGFRNFLNPFLCVRKVRILFSAPFLNIYWEKEIIMSVMLLVNFSRGKWMGCCDVKCLMQRVYSFLCYDVCPQYIFQCFGERCKPQEKHPSKNLRRKKSFPNVLSHWSKIYKEKLKIIACKIKANGSSLLRIFSS